MRSSSALSEIHEQKRGPLGGMLSLGVVGQGSTAPALATFLQRDIAQTSAQVLAFNSPNVIGSAVMNAKRDRDFQVIEAFVAVTFQRPLDDAPQTRRVLASLRIGDDQPVGNIRARLKAQAEAFFTLMAKAGREDMFARVITH